MSYGSAAYVAGYVRKKVSKFKDPDHYMRVIPETGELVQLEQEFARMSRRPAIARQWIERYWRDVYPRDRVVMDGREVKPPRYYDKWMDANEPAVMEKVRDKRWAQLEDKTTKQLHDAAANHEARVRLFARRDGV